MESEPDADAPGSPGPAGPLPATGDSRVDEAVSQLADLAGQQTFDDLEVATGHQAFACLVAGVLRGYGTDARRRHQ